jgi:hypothetical protein
MVNDKNISLKKLDSDIENIRRNKANPIYQQYLNVTDEVCLIFFHYDRMQI